MPRKKKNLGERRIPLSGEGRLKFQQGGAHALDAQIDEAQRILAELADQAAQIPAMLSELAGHQQIAERLADEDLEFSTWLHARYRERKHQDHIVATLRIF